jgi:hypothetical protein
MCNSAAFLVDHVIPDVPLRQWVLSVPFELRLVLARRSDALNYVGRVFVREVFRWQRERARELGLADAQSGAIEWPQRFGGSLNLNVHFHLAAPDGVFTRSPAYARAQFHRLPRPGHSDLDGIARNISIRVERWLRRKQLVRDADQALFNNETPELEPLEACLQGSLGIGELTCLPGATEPAASDAFGEPPKPSKSERRGGHHGGFDLHAGVVVSASDREGRERLLRYCGRPPLSLERLNVTDDGMIAYRLRRPFGRGQTHRVMTPMQFMARLVALIPPPRCPLIRFHGVFAPHSSWRSSVVPETSTFATQHPEHPCAGERASTAAAGGQGRAPPSTTPSGSPLPAEAAAVLAQPVSTAAESNMPQNDSIGPRFSAPWRIDWASVLRRVYREDVLACSCGGRLRVVAVVTEPEAARSMLGNMGLPADPPPIARARSPAFDPEPSPPEWE